MEIKMIFLRKTFIFLIILNCSLAFADDKSKTLGMCMRGVMKAAQQNQTERLTKISLETWMENKEYMRKVLSLATPCTEAGDLNEEIFNKCLLQIKSPKDRDFMNGFYHPPQQNLETNVMCAMAAGKM